MQQSINILQLSSEKVMRGGEQQVAQMLDLFAAIPGVNSFVAARTGSAFEEHCRVKGIPVFPLPFANAIDLRTAFAIRKICREHNIHVVHMHSSKSHGIAVLSAVLGNKTPLVLSRRVIFSPKNSWLTRWKYNHPSIARIVCVADTVRKKMQDYVKRPELCITINSGIDLSLYDKVIEPANIRRDMQAATGDIVIGNAAALEKEKAFPVFIDVIALLAARGYPVRGCIVGKGSLEAMLREHAVRQGVADRIYFAGYRRDVAAIMKEWDIFLSTSTHEGLGTTVLEALLAGVPTVATPAGGIPEMVIPGQSGLLAPMGDAEGIAREVEKVLTDETLRKTIIEGARVKVREFSKENTAFKTLTLYRELQQQHTAG
jgi:L-malate glycosyltransferase